MRGTTKDEKNNKIISNIIMRSIFLMKFKLTGL